MDRSGGKSSNAEAVLTLTVADCRALAVLFMETARTLTLGHGVRRYLSAAFAFDQAARYLEAGRVADARVAFGHGHRLLADLPAQPEQAGTDASDECERRLSAAEHRQLLTKLGRHQR